MFPFFKHKIKNNEIKSKSATNSLLSQIIENKKEIAKLNFLSPIQIEKVLKNNKDIDFLDFEFKKEMDYPDIEYLANDILHHFKWWFPIPFHTNGIIPYETVCKTT